MTHLSRRRFLEESMLAATAAALTGGTPAKLLADEPKQSTSPNERLSIAVIGVRSQGNGHLVAYSTRNDTEVTYVCDADADVGTKRAAETGERQQGRTPKYVQDLREGFDDPSVDCVSTATPNHWHALVSTWAMQHGKDVYVEKPVSHNVSEGRRMAETSKSKRSRDPCPCSVFKRSKSLMARPATHSE